MRANYAIIHKNYFLQALELHNPGSVVIYKSKMTHGKNKRNFLVMNAEEFIAAITKHVPKNHFR